MPHGWILFQGKQFFYQVVICKIFLKIDKRIFMDIILSNGFSFGCIIEYYQGGAVYCHTVWGLFLSLLSIFLYFIIPFFYYSLLSLRRTFSAYNSFA